jgi:hypothetical protein
MAGASAFLPFFLLLVETCLYIKKSPERGKSAIDEENRALIQRAWRDSFVLSN